MFPHTFHVNIVQLRPQHFQQTFGLGFRPFGHRHLPGVALLHFGNNHVRLLRGQLAAVLPINFITIIFLGIVAGCYHNAGNSLFFPHCKGEGGGGAQLGKEVGFDVVGGQHQRCFLCKLLGEAAGIVGDSHAAGFGLGAVLADTIGQGLGQAAN